MQAQRMLSPGQKREVVANIVLHCLIVIVELFNNRPTPRSTSMEALIQSTIETSVSIGTIGLMS